MSPNPPPAPDYELLMFGSSHYNEKARWALDYKGLAHRRTPLVPGPHARRVTKLTGQSAVPVLIADGRPLPGSAQILDELERRHPDPPLYPEDPQERERALQVQAHFDEQVGPMIRRALFSILIEEPRYLAALFAGHLRAPARALYSGVFPLVRNKMKREMQVFEPHVSEAFEATRLAFERVEKDVGPSGYLVGDAFSVADLSAAALLAPAVDVDHADMRKPELRPPAFQEWLAQWHDRPGAQWVAEIYARHRPAR